MFGNMIIQRFKDSIKVAVWLKTKSIKLILFHLLVQRKLIQNLVVQYLINALLILSLIKINFSVVIKEKRSHTSLLFKIKNFKLLNIKINQTFV